MQNYYSGNLQIISLILKERSEDDYYCGVSLTKGIHEFGKIKFYLQKDCSAFYFQQPRIINFYFPPKMLNRSDVFFHLNFEDMDTEEYFGSIGISTNKLSDIFASDKNAVLDEEHEFFQGAKIRFKIYLPKIQVYRHERYSITEQSKQAPTGELDIIIDSLFSRPDVKKAINQRRDQKPKETKSTAQQPKNFLSIFSFLAGKKQPTEEPFPEGESQQGSQLASNLLISTITHIKDEQVKKHTLMPAREAVHHSHSLSIKLKTVIFLLIIGFLALVYDSFNDRGPRVINKLQNQNHPKKVKPKKKNKKTKK